MQPDRAPVSFHLCCRGYHTYMTLTSHLRHVHAAETQKTDTETPVTRTVAHMDTGADYYRNLEASSVTDGTNDCVCLDVFNFYATYVYEILPVYIKAPTLSPLIAFIITSVPLV